MDIEEVSEINFPFSPFGVSAVHRSDKVGWMRDWMIQGKNDIEVYSVETVGRNLAAGLSGTTQVVFQFTTGFVHYTLSDEEKLSGYFERDDLRGTFYWDTEIPTSWRIKYRGKFFIIKERSWYQESHRCDVVLAPYVET